MLSALEHDQQHANESAVLSEDQALAASALEPPPLIAASGVRLNNVTLQVVVRGQGNVNNIPAPLEKI